MVTVIGRRIIANTSSVPSLLAFQPHPWFYSTPLTDSFAMFCQSLQEKTFSVTCDQRGWIMNVIVHSMAIPTHVWRRTLQREMIQRGQRSHMCWSLAWDLVWIGFLPKGFLCQKQILHEITWMKWPNPHFVLQFFTAHSWHHTHPIGDIWNSFYFLQRTTTLICQFKCLLGALPLKYHVLFPPESFIWQILSVMFSPGKFVSQ